MAKIPKSSGSIKELKNNLIHMPLLIIICTMFISNTDITISSSLTNYKSLLEKLVLLYLVVPLY